MYSRNRKLVQIGGGRFIVVEFQTVHALLELDLDGLFGKVRIGVLARNTAGDGLVEVLIIEDVRRSRHARQRDVINAIRGNLHPEVQPCVAMVAAIAQPADGLPAACIGIFLYKGALAAKFQKLCFYMDRCRVLIQDNGIVLPVMVHRAEGNYNRMVSCNVLKRIGGNGTGRLAIHQDVRHLIAAVRCHGKGLRIAFLHRNSPGRGDDPVLFRGSGDGIGVRHQILGCEFEFIQVRARMGVRCNHQFAGPWLRDDQIKLDLLIGCAAVAIDAHRTALDVFAAPIDGVRRRFAEAAALVAAVHRIRAGVGRHIGKLDNIARLHPADFLAVARPVILFDPHIFIPGDGNQRKELRLSQFGAFTGSRQHKRVFRGIGRARLQRFLGILEVRQSRADLLARRVRIVIYSLRFLAGLCKGLPSGGRIPAFVFCICGVKRRLERILVDKVVVLDDDVCAGIKAQNGAAARVDDLRIEAKVPSHFGVFDGFHRYGRCILAVFKSDSFAHIVVMPSVDSGVRCGLEIDGHFPVRSAHALDGDVLCPSLVYRIAGRVNLKHPCALVVQYKCSVQTGRLILADHAHRMLAIGQVVRRIKDLFQRPVGLVCVGRSHQIPIHVHIHGPVVRVLRADDPCLGAGKGEAGFRTGICPHTGFVDAVNGLQIPVAAPRKFAVVDHRQPLGHNGFLFKRALRFEHTHVFNQRDRLGTGDIDAHLVGTDRRAAHQAFCADGIAGAELFPTGIGVYIYGKFGDALSQLDVLLNGDDVEQLGPAQIDGNAAGRLAVIHGPIGVCIVVQDIGRGVVRAIPAHSGGLCGYAVLFGQIGAERIPDGLPQFRHAVDEVLRQDARCIRGHIEQQRLAASHRFKVDVGQLLHALWLFAGFPEPAGGQGDVAFADAPNIAVGVAAVQIGRFIAAVRIVVVPLALLIQL